MKDLRKNDKLMSLLLPVSSALGLIGAVIGFAKAESGAGLSDIVGSMFAGAIFILFVGGMSFGMYAPLLYDLWDWICHRREASNLGDATAGAVMSALSDARAAICKMNEQVGQSSAALNAIVEIKYNRTDEHECRAMITRIEAFLAQRFAGRDADLCVTAINENDLLSGLRKAIDDYRVESAERVAKSSLSSDVRMRMLKRIDEEFGRVQSDFARAKDQQLRIVALAKQSLPRTNAMVVRGSD